MYDWLVVFKDVSTKEYTVIVNDKDKLQKFIDDHKNKIFFGYNNKAFDNIILSAILSGADPYSVMLLLFKKVPVFSIYKTLGITQINIINFDLMQDILGMSLKEAEGFMKMSIEESSVPFDLDRKMTDKELEETIFYCKHDVDSTIEFLHIREEYVKTKMDLIKMFNLSISDLSCTNATLCAKILQARKVERDDAMKYDIPSSIQIKNKEYQKAVELYTNGDLDYDKTLKLVVGGIEHKLAYGGLHAARENFFYDGEMWNIDVTSYYPSMMIRYNFLSRSAVSLEKFKEIYDDRVLAKKAGDKAKANALKLVLNTTYGCMKSEYNALYDPKMANQVCITGQLLFIDLIEKLEPYITLVQTNTDGILVIPKNKERVKEELHKWEERSGMHTEIDVCHRIWQKDVNNYIMVIEDKGKTKIKTKGAYVAQYSGGIKNSAKILDKAVVEYFVNGVAPEDTIKHCDDKYMFQIICKTGGTYTDTVWKSDKGNIKTNRVNRVYASTNHNHGNLYKVKTGEKVRNDSIANLPEHCIVDNEDKLTINDIDKQWYIDIAIKRINDFKGD